MKISEKTKALQKHDYFVGARNPEVTPAFSGKFMVADAIDPDVYAIVGDNLDALVEEAYDDLIGGNFVD